jgi:hypothetical protein
MTRRFQEPPVGKASFVQIISIHDRKLFLKINDEVDTIEGS